MLHSTCSSAIYRLILDILSKLNLSIRGLSSLIYPVYLKINLFSLLFLLILNIRNHPSFAISTINIFILLFYSRIRSIICKRPKYMFPLQIDCKTCHEDIAGALQEFCNRWCKPEHIESKL